MPSFMPAKSDSITAVIPNWNGEARLRKLLPTLLHCKVIVVDNNSQDRSCEVARACGALCITLDANYGFAKAVNTGILATGTRWVAILNNDIALAEGFFEQLLAADADFAAPRILSAANPAVIDGAFDLPTRSGAAYRAGAGRPAEDATFLQPRQIHCAPMTAALFRRELFDTVGLLDESFGSYLEDVDFGIRCAIAGRHGRYVPSAVAYHEGSATLGGAWSAGSTQWISRNQMLLWRKHGGGWWPAVWGQALWGLLAVRNGVGRAWLKGKIEGLHVPMQHDCHQNWLSMVLQSEQEIRDLQRQAGFDWYWRQYFRGIGQTL